MSSRGKSGGKGQAGQTLAERSRSYATDSRATTAVGSAGKRGNAGPSGQPGGKKAPNGTKKGFDLEAFERKILAEQEQRVRERERLANTPEARAERETGRAQAQANQQGMPELSSIYPLRPGSDEPAGTPTRYAVSLDWDNGRLLEHANEYGAPRRGYVQSFATREEAQQAAWDEYHNNEDWQAYLRYYGG